VGLGAKRVRTTVMAIGVYIKGLFYIVTAGRGPAAAQWRPALLPYPQDRAHRRIASYIVTRQTVAPAEAGAHTSYAHPFRSSKVMDVEKRFNQPQS
jgi:hypothetical protein